MTTNFNAENYNVNYADHIDTLTKQIDSLANNNYGENNMTDFIDKVVNGSLVYNPVDGGNENGKFIGYAIELESKDEDENKISVYTIIDKNGNSVMNVEPEYIYTDSYRVEFCLQPEIMHTVAYRVSEKRDWQIKKLSDRDLNKQKHCFSSYQIIDSVIVNNKE